MPWCVAIVKSREIGLATENLYKQGFEAYNPLIKKFSKKFGSVLVPLFPGYLFVKIRDDGQWRAICSTVGVYKLILASPEAPAVLPKNWVETLMSHGDYVSSVEEVFGFKVGDKVKFSKGIMEGKDGVCTFIAQDRIAILLSLLNREVVVYSKPEALELVVE